MWFDPVMRVFQTHLRLAVTCLLAVALASCTTVPETGRRQLNLLSPGEEMQLGLTSFDKMKKETTISKDPAANALVQKVGKRIAAVAPLPNAQWEFVVFESKEANAFCLPGGKVGVYAGILPITRDEDGLATVLGHETAHAAAHHGGEQMSRAMAMQAGGEVVGSYVGSAAPQWQNAANIVGRDHGLRPGHAIGNHAALQPRARIGGGSFGACLHGARRLRSRGGGRVLAKVRRIHAASRERWNTSHLPNASGRRAAY